MAIYRKIDTSFWQDGFILDLTPDEKYFYLYLMTNSKTSQCGIYEIHKRIMMLETGFDKQTVDQLLQKFVEEGKIFYDEETSEVFLLNWVKFNWSNSEKVISRVNDELKELKNQGFAHHYYNLCIEYGYSIDTLWIPERQEKEEEEEKEEETKEEKEVIPYREIVEYLNSACDTSFKHTSETHKSKIRARWNEGYRLDDFHVVIDKKAKEWKHNDMAKYLRPSTLFGTKFDEYLNQIIVDSRKPPDPDDLRKEYEAWANEEE